MDDLRAPGALDAPEALVPLARSGDRVALARIVRLHRTEMVRVAYVVAGDERLALEAAARAWPVAARRLGDLREPSRLGPWLCAIAAREACSVARGRPSPDDVPAGRSDGPGADDPDDPELARALAALSPDDRLLLALDRLAGASPAEIGRTIGVPGPVAAVRVADVGSGLGIASHADLTARLRAHAAIPVAPVLIDEEARRAFVTRNDHRIRVASVAVAIVVTAIVVSVSYIVGPPPLPSGIGSPSPSPSVDTGPSSSDPVP